MNLHSANFGYQKMQSFFMRRTEAQIRWHGYAGWFEFHWALMSEGIFPDIVALMINNQLFSEEAFSPEYFSRSQVYHSFINGRRLCENEPSGVCGQRRPRSACASAQADQGLHCPLIESLDTTECIIAEQRPGRYFAHAQDDSNLCVLRMLEDIFSL